MTAAQPPRRDDDHRDANLDSQPRVVRTPTGGVRLVVLPAEDGMRLDLLLAAAAGCSRRAARRLAGDGAVLRNQRPLRILSKKLAAGDVIELSPAAGVIDPPPAAAIPTPTILFEDGWLVAANKPAGVLSQPAERTAADELAFDQALLLHLGLRDGRRPYLRLVHRLDRLTSGVVLAARNPQALPRLTAAWKARRVDRLYLAVVEGRIDDDELEIDRPIERDHGHAWRFAVGERGRPAVTRVRVLARGPDDSSVLECRLLTGRTHQVRVHLAAIGHPVLGDRLYGAAREAAAARPLLHAVSVRLPHPRDGAPVRISSPPPPEFAGWVSPAVLSAFGADPTSA